MAWSGRGRAVSAMVGCVAALAGCGPRGCGRAHTIRYQLASSGLPHAGLWKSHVAVGDVNGDGFPDLGVVSRLADGPHVFLGDGHGNWRDSSSGLPHDVFCGGGMQFADANNDGKMDVAIADHCRGAFVFLGNGQGAWQAGSTGLPAFGCEDVAVGDFNGDACLDVALVAAGDQGVHAFLGDCKGVWTEHSEGLVQSGWGNSIIAADLDRDGHLDLAAAHAAGPRVWLGDGRGSWREASAGLPAPETGGLYWGIALGDVNGDGLLDVATGGAGPGPEVFVQEPGPAGPHWRPAGEGIPSYPTLGVALADLNRDGHTDLLIAAKTASRLSGGTYGLVPIFGDGRGHWQLGADTGLPNSGRERIWGVGVADFNADGVLDVAAAFGDVMNPHPRPRRRAERELAAPGRTRGPRPAPERGAFGGVDVWLGHQE
jgi:hypothetical protein